MKRPASLPSQAEIEELLTSGEFDPFWYDEAYPDIRLSGLGPAEHYLLIGQRLGRPGRAERAESQLLPADADPILKVGFAVQTDD